jgi:ubiquinone/menaquinone biosynthesis C-methylase UbiE
MINSNYLDNWIKTLIRHPVTKLTTELDDFETINGFLDLRIPLRNTLGYKSWKAGQNFFENWEQHGSGYVNGTESYLEEINADKEIYDKFVLEDSVLDVGGLSGTLRHFITQDCKYVCIDPFENAPHAFPKEKKEAYKCLSSPYNFIVGNAEFLPFRENSFQFVHMRSMLDHVQIPDLSLLEANRVLKSDGRLIIGMTVEGGRNGRISLSEKIKDVLRITLGVVGFKQFVDHHTWHPTHKGLIKLANDNGFIELEEIWQSKWKDRVVYIIFKKA